MSYIDRQAAIDGAVTIQLFDRDIPVVPVQHIKSLPSAQSTQTNTPNALESLDCVSRQEAIDKLEPWLKVHGYSEGELNMLKAVLYELRSLPSAERKKGKWIKRQTNTLTEAELQSALCSECGRWHTTPYIYRFCKYNFCPNCGAYMRGENNGKNNESDM